MKFLKCHGLTNLNITTGNSNTLILHSTLSRLQQAMTGPCHVAVLSFAVG